MAKKIPLSEMLWRSRRGFLAVLLVVPLTPIIIFATDRARDVIVDLSEVNSFIQKNRKDSTEQEKGGGCNVSSLLDSVSEDITKFSEDLPIVTCEGTDWVNCFKCECNITIAIQKTIKEIVCIYKDIIFVNDRYVYFGNPTTVVGNEMYTLNKSDHVKIDCTGKDMTSSDERSHWSGYGTGFRPVPTKAEVSDQRDSYNVVILCFDSATRHGFIRNMRQSYEYMTKQLNAVVLNSYNIVGNGTTDILFPILTGKSEEELTNQRKRTTKKKYIDSKKFIFHLLKGNGYRTAYFEDILRAGTAESKFNRFRRQPADHYLRLPLLADTDKRQNWNHSENWSQGYPASHCFGAKPQYQLMINLTDQFLQLDGKKFCFTHVADVAYENFILLPTADETLLSFLQTLSARRALEDTLVVIIGNHGSRSSPIQEPTQGKQEDRLPLMAILLPEQLKIKRPKTLTTLKNNEDVLTTPFDIHATILDVLNLKNKNNRNMRGMSLLEPIPKSRSCGEAGVMPHRCACAH
ncbi:hypothetical protein PYW07_010728 [Mythimna separata]|uniref:Uncharacterized protein n=1 Tax=Mythimna separata TaxID=271217 RepID=A0AAD7Y7T7_MYTSE|nr:hypothetical protein PYW07_010728 [Mythimna separata]